MTAARMPPEPGMTYPYAKAPAFCEALTIAPGVLWIRLPLPLDLDHVNVWAIEDGDGYALVDAGFYTAEAPGYWHGILERHLRGRPVTRVFVTHAHEDHVGMAGWFAEVFGSKLWMTSPEYDQASEAKAMQSAHPCARGLAFFRDAGWTDAALDEHRLAYGKPARWIYPLPRHYRPVFDAEVVTIGAHEWHILTGSGHARLHACLYCPALALLISGDQVLPRISPNVSVLPDSPNDDPLARWYASLSKLSRLVASHTLILPAHNLCFHGLHTRLAQMTRGHDDALARLLDVLDVPRLVTETFGALFGRNITSGTTLRLATGEAIAHLNHLRHAGKVVCSTDQAGVRRYVRA